MFPTPDISETDVIYLQANYNFGLYSPNAGNSQDFGVFDGSTFSGNLTLPQQYENAIILGMMKQMFKDIEGGYERELHLLKVLQYSGEKFEYGFNDYTEIKDTPVPTTGNTMIDEITSSSLDSADKYARITIIFGTDPPTFTVESQRGWSSPPTLLSDDGNILTIASADNEFATRTLVLKNNDNIDANRVSTNQITLNYFGSDYGTLTFLS